MTRRLQPGPPRRPSHCLPPSWPSTAHLWVQSVPDPRPLHACLQVALGDAPATCEDLSPWWPQEPVGLTTLWTTLERGGDPLHLQFQPQSLRGPDPKSSLRFETPAAPLASLGPLTPLGASTLLHQPPPPGHLQVMGRWPKSQCKRSGFCPTLSPPSETRQTLAKAPLESRGNVPSPLLMGEHRMRTMGLVLWWLLRHKP